MERYNEWVREIQAKRIKELLEENSRLAKAKQELSQYVEVVDGKPVYRQPPEDTVNRASADHWFKLNREKSKEIKELRQQVKDMAEDVKKARLMTINENLKAVFNTKTAPRIFHLEHKMPDAKKINEQEHVISVLVADRQSWLDRVKKAEGYAEDLESALRAYKRRLIKAWCVSPNKDGWKDIDRIVQNFKADLRED